ncbi:MAG: KUP/HAK/KT family potassium transporter, partial [Acidimicrobiaceae bacterium]
MGSDNTVDRESVEHARQLAEQQASEAQSSADTHDHSHGHGHGHTTGTVALALGALGIVYGDIGTSPLYSFKEAFNEKTHVMTLDQIKLIGIRSLAVCSLIIISSSKNLMFV